MRPSSRLEFAATLGCLTALALACGDESVSPLGTGGASTTTSTSTGPSTSSAGGTANQGGAGGMLASGGAGMGGMLGAGGLGMGGMPGVGGAGMGGMFGAGGGGAGGGIVPTLVPDFAILDANPNSATSGQLVSPRDHLGRVSAWYFGHST
jgi:hypothetical protein